MKPAFKNIQVFLDQYAFPAHLFVLSAFAVAQPLFDLLSRNKEYFTALNSKPLDVVVLVLGLILVIPGVLSSISLALEKASPILYKAWQFILLTILAGIILLPVLNPLPMPGILIITAALMGGCVFSALYFRLGLIRQYLTILLPVVILFPLIFMVFSPVRKVVFPKQHKLKQEITLGHKPPIVFLIFDELPVTSLMNSKREIDAERFPGFGALAQNADWYREATGNSDVTMCAVPAILTGTYPSKNCREEYSGAPNNLFSLVGGSYEMNVFEPLTQLCPDFLCKPRNTLPMGERLGNLFQDMSIIFLHIVLPKDLSLGLPKIDENWGNFVARKQEKFSRGRYFEQFETSLKAPEGPVLHFLHIELPHTPYIYLPSGKEYEGFDNFDSQMGSVNTLAKAYTNDWILTQRYQRHLLQLKYVDSLLLKVISRLKETGLYDQALIIATADHGVSFEKGIPSRDITPENFHDEMPIPMFIKWPEQTSGKIMEKPVENIDLLPTLAEYLKADVDWKFDGQSILSSKGKTTKHIYRKSHEGFEFKQNDFSKKYQTLEKKLALFGEGSIDKIYRVGPIAELVGKHMNDLETGHTSPLSARIEDFHYFQSVSPDDHFLPIRVVGSLVGNGVLSNASLALVINQKVVAVSPILKKDQDTYFSFMIPESVFQKPLEQMEIFLAQKQQGRILLSAIQTESPVVYTLKPEERKIVSSQGKTFALQPNALRGRVALKEVRRLVGKHISENDYLDFKGWAIDSAIAQPASRILVFADNRFIESGIPEQKAPEALKRYGKKAENAGFRIRFPVSRLNDLHQLTLRFFAISTSSGTATELEYPLDFHQSYKQFD